LRCPPSRCSPLGEQRDSSSAKSKVPPHGTPCCVPRVCLVALAVSASGLDNVCRVQHRRDTLGLYPCSGHAPAASAGARASRPPSVLVAVSPGRGSRVSFTW